MGEFDNEIERWGEVDVPSLPSQLICSSDSRLKKMEKSEVDLWRCNSCLNKTDVSNDIIDLEKKIHDLKVVDSLDHETSLTLAAEVGNALMNENMLLKQELHELKAKAGEGILEIEDRLKAAEDIIHELTEKNHNLQQDIIYLNKKLEKELSINQDLLEQAESEKNHYFITITDLNSKKAKLEDKIKRLTTKLDELSQKATCDEVERNGLRTRIVDLVAREESLSLQVNEKGKMIGLMKTESEELVMKISDLEGAARAYLRSFLGNIKSKIKLNICQNIEHDMPQEQYSPKTFVTPSILCPPPNNLLSSPISSTFETLTVPGLDSQTSSKKLTQAETGGDRQTSTKKLIQSITGGDRQISPKKLIQSITGGDRQTSPKKLIQSITGGDRQTSPKKTDSIHNRKRQTNIVNKTDPGRNRRRQTNLA
ncbi:hypothetical protein J6590_035074 [Homalodisca vitripennis]|nr:hypothetical protein J6590_035074 [Homalodisca vitripennis]